MKWYEKIALTIRHSSLLRNSHGLWHKVRPLYNRITRHMALERTINGTDTIKVVGVARGTSETYEPDVWRAVMAALRPKDIVIDVGTYIGLYTIAIAQRLTTEGRVIAIEPDPNTFRLLQQHIALNDVQDRVTAFNVAAAERVGEVWFRAKGDLQSTIVQASDEHSIAVPVQRLDQIVERADILKIDVEGFEERVLEGAAGLFSNVSTAPRVLFIEVHPYAWEAAGTTSDSLLKTLRSYGYRATTVEGAVLTLPLTEWGEIMAMPV